MLVWGGSRKVLPMIATVRRMGPDTRAGDRVVDRRQGVYAPRSTRRAWRHEERQ